MRMSKKTIKFIDVEIEKPNFHSFKSLTNISNLDIDKVLTSYKFGYDERVLSISSATRVEKQLSHCASSSLKWVSM